MVASKLAIILKISYLILRIWSDKAPDKCPTAIRREAFVFALMISITASA